MKILCLNAWGGKMYDVLLPYLTEQDPDILCLQEVVHSPTSDLDWLTYRDDERTLPQRANFLRDVSKALPDHMVTFCPTGRGVLWDQERSVPSLWGLATFVRSTIPVIAQAQGFVHRDYSADGFGDEPRSRTGHAVRVWDHEQDRAVSVTQMHGLRDPRGKMGTPERLAQAHRLIALSDQVSMPGDLRVLCGDFNVEPDSETLRLLRSAGFTELVADREFPGTRTSLYQKPGRFADYMLINRPEAAQHFDVVYQPEVSDHCPLVLIT